MAAKKIPDYRRASQQRLAGAELLLKYGAHLDAIYLGGYSVECALKALILARTPAGQRSVNSLKISKGERGHDFELLAVFLKEMGCQMPVPIVDKLRDTLNWSTEWRYKVGFVQHSEAKKFLDAVREIRAWVERSL